MKTKIIFLTTLIACILLQGCVFSLYPLYTKDDLVFDKRLLGSWGEGDDILKIESLLEHEQAKPNKSKVEIELNKKKNINKNTYLFTSIEKGKTTKFEANLTKLGDDLFLDLYPYDFNEIIGSFDQNFVPAHTYAKVKIDDNKFELQFFDLDFLNKILDQNNIRLKHETFQDYKVITASTEELRQFVKKYAGRKELFYEPSVMIKTK